MEYKIEDLKCCGNCWWYSKKLERQCANDNDGTYADPEPYWSCKSWEWDNKKQSARL